jgi:nucleotide-binding universal stress UspA family protein
MAGPCPSSSLWNGERGFPMSLIIVGVDGSDASKEALRWAVAEAALRRATVRAVHAWTYPTLFGGAYVPLDEADTRRLRDEAQEMLDAVVDEVAGRNPPAYIERRVEQGPAAGVLIDAAREADLLVVGSRGRGGFAELLLGSVSQQCAHHAACVVAIVRARQDSRPADG